LAVGLLTTVDVSKYTYLNCISCMVGLFNHGLHYNQQAALREAKGLL